MITTQFQKFDHMLQALTYFESNHVPVVYLGPLPDYKMIAFVLVLETRERLPKKFHKRAVKELFPEKIPCKITSHKDKGQNLTSQ